MALFKRNVQHYTQPDSQRRPKVAPPHAPQGFPERLKRLDVLCRDTAAHPLPVKMKFISESTSDRGQAMAVYACPYHECNWRTGWVINQETGKPFRLWAGRHVR
jgi:hypothetical protein